MQFWVLIAIGLAMLCATAVRSHMTNPERLGAVVGGLGIPERVAWAATGIEAGVAVLLVVSPKLGGLTLAGYLIALMLIFGIARLSGLAIDDCGCFKAARAVSGAWFVRNAVLTLLATGVASAGPDGRAVIGLVAAAAVGSTVTVLIARRAGMTQRNDIRTQPATSASS